MNAIAIPRPVLTEQTITDMEAQASAGTLSFADFKAELERRILKRRAAGKPALPYVTVRRNELENSVAAAAGRVPDLWRVADPKLTKAAAKAAGLIAAGGSPDALADEIVSAGYDIAAVVSALMKRIA